jgi:hypothetical protein
VLPGLFASRVNVAHDVPCAYRCYDACRYNNEAMYERSRRVRGNV